MQALLNVSPNIVASFSSKFSCSFYYTSAERACVCVCWFFCFCFLFCFLYHYSFVALLSANLLSICFFSFSNNRKKNYILREKSKKAKKNVPQRTMKKILWCGPPDGPMHCTQLVVPHTHNSNIVAIYIYIYRFLLSLSLSVCVCVYATEVPDERIYIYIYVSQHVLHIAR